MKSNKIPTAVMEEAPQKGRLHHVKKHGVLSMALVGILGAGTNYLNSEASASQAHTRTGDVYQVVTDVLTKTQQKQLEREHEAAKSRHQLELRVIELEKKLAVSDALLNQLLERGRPPGPRPREGRPPPPRMEFAPPPVAPRKLRFVAKLPTYSDIAQQAHTDATVGFILVDEEE